MLVVSSLPKSIGTALFKESDFVGGVLPSRKAAGSCLTLFDEEATEGAFKEDFKMDSPPLTSCLITGFLSSA